MPDSDVHKKKRKKNILIFGLIIGWIVMIWLITMVRIGTANAQELEGYYYNQRTTHIEEMETQRSEMDQKRVDHQDTTVSNRKQIDAKRDTHQEKMVEAQARLDEQRVQARDAIEAQRESYDAPRQAHQDEMAPNAESWWDGWEDRLYPEDYVDPSNE